MEIQALAQLGKLEKEIELGGLKVKFHTLSVSEQQKALASIPSNITDDTTRFTYFQEAMLVHATDTVNGEAVDTVKARAFYKDLQYPLLAELFSRYMELTAEQSKVLDELKKK
jgi:hypothetical protein